MRGISPVLLCAFVVVDPSADGQDLVFADGLALIHSAPFDR